MKFFDYDLSAHRWYLLPRHVQEIEAVFGERKMPSAFILHVLEGNLYQTYNYGTDEDLRYLRDLVRFCASVVPYHQLENVHSKRVDVRAFCNSNSHFVYRLNSESEVICTNTWSGEETYLDGEPVEN